MNWEGALNRGSRAYIHSASNDHFIFPIIALSL